MCFLEVYYRTAVNKLSSKISIQFIFIFRVNIDFMEKSNVHKRYFFP